MTPEQIDRLINMLVTIGGAAAKKGFAIAVRRVTFLAWINFSWAAALVLASTVLAVTGRKLWKKHKAKRTDEYYDDEWAFAAGCSYVFSLVGLVTATNILVSGLDRIVNSEWHAVMMLLDLIK